MACDDSEHEEECLESAEEPPSDNDESYGKAECSDDSESGSGKAPINPRASVKLGQLSRRPPRPPRAAFPRPGANRSSLGCSLPSLPPRPAVSRLKDEGDEADDVPPSEAELQRRREENIRALVNNSLQTCRQPLMSKFLSVMESQVVLRKPFQSPLQGAPRMSDALRRKLAARRHFVPWGSSTPLPVPTMTLKPANPVMTVLPEPLAPEPPAPEPPAAEPALPEGIDPLVLWQAPPGAAADGAATDDDGSGGSSDSVVVDNMLVRFLRPHQREGVQFMFDCVTGQRLEGKQGCILADDMGLGKTLQGITLMWTLLTAGHPLLGGCPIARRAIIVCPTSLVSNWDNECVKWLQGRLKTLALCETSREDVVANIGLFLHPSNVYKVLIISYETFRMHAERFQVPHACDLLLCDEAHRLKNDATLTNRALDNLACKRRVLLSGTPMQNHLDEFFAMVDFCNPGVLGLPAQFRKHYELPILAGREPDAAPEEVALGEDRSRELSGLTNNFILRRTNKLLSQHLPPKVIEVVCCRLTELQRQLYCHFLQSKAARRVLNGRTSGVLSAITSLKKLCNHPKLIYDAVHSKAAAVGAGGGGEDGEGGRADGFEDVGSLFPPGLFDNGRVGRGGMAAGWETVSGKMAVLARMLHVMYTETNDRIVLVSNYTSTLDLFVQLCRERGYPFVRLDGTTTINKRQKLVKVFNDAAERQFAFLLSSKAGGCGLNLIGANRLVLFDPDWNPANDQQAAARVWRDGQRKRVFVYRFLTTGSIEEKVYQRQLSKEGLKQLVSKNGKAVANVMTAEDLRELFTLNADTWSDTYDYMCGGPGSAAEVPPPPPPAATGSYSPIDLAAVEEDDDRARKGTGGRPSRGATSGTQAGDGATENGRLAPIHKRQSGEPTEEDLANWGHHPNPETVPDAVMRRVAAPDVSFIFSCGVAGKFVEGGDEEERRLSEPPAPAAAAAAPGTAVQRGVGVPVSLTVTRGAAMRVGGMSSRGGSARAVTPGGVRAIVPEVTRPATAAGIDGGVTLSCRTQAVSAAIAVAMPTATATPLVGTPAPMLASHTPGSGSSMQGPSIRVPTSTAATAATAMAVVATVQPSAPPGTASTSSSTGAAATTVASPIAAGASRPAATAAQSSGDGTRPQLQPQLQPNPGSAGRPTSQKATAATAASNGGGGGGGGNSSRTSSSVTGALISSGVAPPSGSGNSAGGSLAGGSKALGQPKGPLGDNLPMQPLRNSTAPNAQSLKPAAESVTSAAPTASRLSGSAPEALQPPLPPPAAQSRSGGRTGFPATGPAAAQVAAAATADGGKGAVRGRDVMDVSGGAGLEGPKPKRKRAPGWYIDSDDDDFL